MRLWPRMLYEPYCTVIHFIFVQIYNLLQKEITSDTDNEICVHFTYMNYGLWGWCSWDVMVMEMRYTSFLFELSFMFIWLIFNVSLNLD